jgi:transcriptional regulator with XRE-family HTH domain
MIPGRLNYRTSETDQCPQSPPPRRQPNPRDIEVGRRLRAQRLERRLSQKEFGQKIGVSLHQVQKYETGTNRISAGRLQRIAEVLSVPVTFFFDGQSVTSGGEQVFSPLDYLSTEVAVRLARAFSKIENSKIRYAVVQIVECIAGESAKPIRKRRRAK